jgi:hypothetical protein
MTSTSELVRTDADVDDGQMICDQVTGWRILEMM